MRTCTAALLLAPAVSAACDRATLQATLDAFLAPLAPGKQDTLTLSPSLKLGQNNQALASLAQSARANTTALLNNFRLTAIDTETCAAAGFVLAKQKNPAGAEEPALVSSRIKTGPDARTITEVEILNVLRGSHAFFKPEAFPAVAPPAWSAPAQKALSRADLVKLVDGYPSGIAAGNGSAIPVVAGCTRVENGVSMPLACTASFERFQQPVTNRRWVVDTQTGVVLGSFYFDKPARFGYDYGLWLNEYFRVEGEKLSAIYAVMKELKGVPFKDLFEGS